MKMKLQLIDGLNPVLDTVPSFSMIEGKDGKITVERGKLQNEKRPFKEMIDLEKVNWDEVLLRVRSYLNRYLKRYYKGVEIELDKEELLKIINNATLICSPWKTKEEINEYATSYVANLIIEYIPKFLKYQKKISKI
ncbi:MAG: hypothetical protein JHC31_00035 [Sulfurihydrogenibium sp.]|nr:hypothetical protein [Sulfurihydrogenibium sp.]